VYSFIPDGLTLPVSCGPQGKTQGIPQKPTLWAVSSSGRLCENSIFEKCAVI
jgi:hypothetical protein